MSTTKHLFSLGLILALAGCALPIPIRASAPITSTPTPTPSQTGFSVFVTLDLHETDLSSNVGDACEGTGGYSDISEGTQVNILDASRKLVAFGNLEAGKRTDPTICEFTATIEVPGTTKALYGVEVSHRGVINFEPRDYVTTTVQLSLGE